MGLSFIRKAVPWLGTIASLAGVPGAAPIAAIASKLLSTHLNKPVDPNSLADVLSEALGDPAQHAQLLAAEQAYQQAMQQMGFQHETDLETLAEKDRESARQMQVQTKSWVPGTLAIAVSGGFFTILGLMFFHKIPDEGHDALMLMLGSLGTAWTGVVTYYFGSSAGSDRKTELLAQAPPVQS